MYSDYEQERMALNLEERNQYFGWTRVQRERREDRDRDRRPQEAEYRSEGVDAPTFRRNPTRSIPDSGYWTGKPDGYIYEDTDDYDMDRIRSTITAATFKLFPTSIRANHWF
jgi:hypothetical protein